jgi:hypothetical protein
VRQSNCCGAIPLAACRTGDFGHETHHPSPFAHQPRVGHQRRRRGAAA